MKLFIDTANIEEIKEASLWGVISGVTTNPTLVAKEGKSLDDVIHLITDFIDGPVSAEVMGDDAQSMVDEAKELAKISDNVVIKIPMTCEGIKAVSQLSKLGIKTNVTLIFTANQALLAAKAGATYVSPFIGRLEDVGEDGIKLVQDIVYIFQQFDLSTQVISASIRHPKHALEAALTGSHISTIPFKVLKQMFKHPLTDAGIALFKQDWAKGQK